jgi:hypothetical protein
VEAEALPQRVFLFTLDQVAQMVAMDLAYMKQRIIYYQGRSVGIKKASLIEAVNISPPDQKPEWRVSEQEVQRWMRAKGFVPLPR